MLHSRRVRPTRPGAALLLCCSRCARRRRRSAHNLAVGAQGCVGLGGADKLLVAGRVDQLVHLGRQLVLVAGRRIKLGLGVGQSGVEGLRGTRAGRRVRGVWGRERWDHAAGAGWPGGPKQRVPHRAGMVRRQGRRRGCGRRMRLCSRPAAAPLTPSQVVLVAVVLSVQAVPLKDCGKGVKGRCGVSRWTGSGGKGMGGVGAPGRRADWAWQAASMQADRRAGRQPMPTQQAGSLPQQPATRHNPHPHAALPCPPSHKPSAQQHESTCRCRFWCADSANGGQHK